MLRRLRYQQGVVLLMWAALLGAAVAVAGLAVGSSALGVLGALVVITALWRGAVLRRRYRSDSSPQ